MFYNGMEDYPETITLKLSDAFMTKSDFSPLELKVKVYLKVCAKRSSKRQRTFSNLVYLLKILQKQPDLLRQKSKCWDNSSLRMQN